MKTRGIFVGVDAYKHLPLESAVKDAVRMRDALVGLGFVANADCRLLTAPLVAGAADLPTRTNLSRYLLEARDNRAGYERLIVFFSGHGEMTFSNPDKSQPRTVILPSDYEGERHQRALNIDLDELLDEFRIAGPREQIFIFDCCREQAADFGAGGGALVWPEPDATGTERAQGALYGVALKGVARGVKGKGGVMTSHIVSALDPKGEAVAYIPAQNTFGVTVELLTEYVRSAVDEELKKSKNFDTGYDLPALVTRGAPTSPFLSMSRAQAGVRPLTIVIEPAEAIPVAQVQLENQNLLAAWPPSGQEFRVAPDRYWLRADVTDPRSDFLPPDPQAESIDVRKVSRRIVRYRKAGAPPPATAVSGADVSAEPQLELRGIVRGGWPRAAAPPTTGRAVAVAFEPQTYVELVDTRPPFRSIGGFVEKSQNDCRFVRNLDKGYYEARFRLGTDVFSKSEFEILPGTTTYIRARAGATPLVLETLPERFVYDGKVIPTGQVSESIGHLQGGIVATLLPALAMRPFDEQNQFLRSFPADLRIPRPEWPNRPVSVIVAVDGELGEDVPVSTLLRSTSLRVRSFAGGPRETTAYAVTPFRPTEPRIGLDRFARAIFEAPAANFSITLESPLLSAPVTAVVASLPELVTAATFLITRDKACAFSLNLLSYPDALQDAAGTPFQSPFPQRLRAVQVAQSLFAANQLFDAPISSQQLDELLWFKWLDPIVAVMALLEMRRQPKAHWRLDSAAQATANLVRYFGDLPDARIVRALLAPAERPALLAGLRSQRAVPVLAESLRQLLAMLQEADLASSALELAQRAAAVALGQPWSLSVEPRTTEEKIGAKR